MRVAVYARKSTEDQLKASVARQVEHARLYARQKGWSVDAQHVYVDDRISGAEFARRPGLTGLLEAASRTPPPFDGLITADSDRIGRGLRSQLVLSDLHDAGIRVFYYQTDHEQRFENATDRAMLSLAGFGGELEREKAKHRTRDALLARARKGLVTGGVVYGYRNVPVYAGTDSSGNSIRAQVRFEVHSEEAAVVRGVFQAYAHGWGLRSIAKGLNGDASAAGISARYFQGRRVPPPRKGTGSWDPSTVRAIVHRERYIGILIWGKHRNVDKGGRTRRRSARPESEWVRTEVPDLRIVSDELWQAVQRRRRPPTSSGGPAAGYSTASLLSGLAQCGLCAGPFTIAGSRKRERCYGCSRHRNRGSIICSNDLLESVSVVDHRVLEEIERTVLTPEARGVALAAAQDVIERSMADAGETAAKFDTALARVSREIENLIRAIELGGTPPPLLERLREREKERAVLARQLAFAKTLRTTSQLERHRLRRRLEEGFSQLGDVLSSEPTLARQALNQLFVGKVRFTPVDVGAGARTYRFEANLSLGRLGAAVAQNDGDVPDGIWTLLFTRFQLLTIVKRAA